MQLYTSYQYCFNISWFASVFNFPMVFCRGLTGFLWQNPRCDRPNRTLCVPFGKDPRGSQLPNGCHLVPVVDRSHGLLVVVFCFGGEKYRTPKRLRIEMWCKIYAWLKCNDIIFWTRCFSFSKTIIDCIAGNSLATRCFAKSLKERSLIGPTKGTLNLRLQPLWGVPVQQGQGAFGTGLVIC